MVRSGARPLCGLLDRRSDLDDTHHVALLHDQQILSTEPNLGARPLAEEDAVADLHVERLQLPALAAGAGSGLNDLAFLWFLLGGVGDDDAAGGLVLRPDPADQDTIMQWTERHARSPLLATDLSSP